jgi:hypothetical protein
MITRLFAVAFALLLSGCASHGVIPISPDTYMVSKTGAGVFSDMASLKADVFREANDFAQRQGKIAIPLDVNERPFIPSVRNPSIELQFRVVNANDPEAQRTSLVPRADVVIEKTEKISTDVRTKEDKAPDLYTELTKLDDLRKKGIITEEEFAAQKKRLLEK